MNLLEYKAKLIRAKNGINQETAKIILKFEKQIVDLVREDQIFNGGENGEGNIIGVYKMSALQPLEHSNGKGYPKIRGTQVNLFDTGKLYKSFTTDYGSFVLEVFPTDSKKHLLMKKYGNNIFFMQSKNQKIVNYDIIGPELLTFIRKTIQG